MAKVVLVLIGVFVIGAAMLVVTPAAEDALKIFAIVAAVIGVLYVALVIVYQMFVGARTLVMIVFPVLQGTKTRRATRAVWVALAASFTNLMTWLTEASDRSEKATIVGVMLLRRARDLAIAYAIALLFGLVVALVPSVNHMYRIAALFTCISFVALLVVWQYTTKFRVKRGYFGSSEAEMRQILQFVLANADLSDFKDDYGRLKPIFPDADADEFATAAVGEPA
ncbi:MAG TPA: hypothetical protein VGF28_04360 [Thermoanaerobaculia bacterium]